MLTCAFSETGGNSILEFPILQPWVS